MGGVGTRVYVGNLSYEVAWQDLKDHMRKVGNVVHADVLEDHEGRSKGCGIVEYDNPHGAMRAIRELNNTDLKGRLIFVREDREDKKMGGPMGGGFQGGASMHRVGVGGPPSAAGRQLYVGNLDFEITWQGLKDHFKGFDVQRAEVAYDAEGRSRGFGTVRFGTAAEAQRAQEALNGTNLNNRTIEVREDNRVL
uniref:Rnp domain-containing protein n=1 Tax=Nannochloropsis gaditana (strain CCMP526) TaxID=1093141 RepID=I2CPF4_NANGC